MLLSSTPTWPRLARGAEGVCAHLLAWEMDYKGARPLLFAWPLFFFFFLLLGASASPLPTEKKAQNRTVSSSHSWRSRTTSLPRASRLSRPFFSLSSTGALSPSPPEKYHTQAQRAASMAPPQDSPPILVLWRRRPLCPRLACNKAVETRRSTLEHVSIPPPSAAALARPLGFFLFSLSALHISPRLAFTPMYKRRSLLPT